MAINPFQIRAVNPSYGRRDHFDFKAIGLEKARQFFEIAGKEYPRRAATPALKSAARVMLQEQKTILRKWGQSRPRTGRRATNWIAANMRLRRAKGFRRNFISFISIIPSFEDQKKQGLIKNRGNLGAVFEFGWNRRAVQNRTFLGVHFLTRGFDRSVNRMWAKIRERLGKEMDKLHRRTL